MPSYKNTERNTWYCAFYFTDWQGKRKKKKKEGFQTKREAQDWERKFLEQFAGTPDISFEVLLAEYKKKQQAKNDLRTYYNECNMIKNHVEPYFTGITIDKITKQSVLAWKEKLAQKNYSASYSKRLYNILKYILDFAVENYNLPSNPCPSKQSFGKINKMMNFWTIDEFRTFMAAIDKPKYIMAFYMLFWTGMRSGEMLGLNWSDVDFDSNAVTIDKSYYRLLKKDYYTDGKTDSSQRVVILPQFLADMLKDYHSMSLYCDDRIFDYPKSALNSQFKRAIKKTGVKPIRLHDLRHSHASLLINSGAEPIAVADRLGHSDASITLKVYSHFYDKKRTTLADKLNTILE